tara:strand:- start:133 stop:1515 length:1383 start_codon:yes stop_codon:yes gene_type:complete
MSLLISVISALMALTVITVLAAKVDLGAMNVPVALAIATIKGTLVAAFFMHLRWDKPFNTIVLITSIGMAALLLLIASMDMKAVMGEKDLDYAVTEMKRLRKEAAAKAAGKEVPDDQIHSVLYPKEHGGEHSSGEHGSAPVDEEMKKAAMDAKFTLGPLLSKASDPPNNPTTPEKITLGKALYFEGRMSKSNQISCNSCHQLDKYGVDGEKTSPGHEGKRGERNSPTVYNAAFHSMQFWDGRADSLEEQAKGPILNPIEMGMPSEGSVIARLKEIKGYEPLFKAAFPGEEDPITYDNVAKAIAAFERTLIMRAPFDDWVDGKHDALTKEQAEGYLLFKSTGCTQCHTGPTMGGNDLKKLGDRVPYQGANFEAEDLGRFAVTKKEGDKHFFKVPSLRNISKTGPYFHDGSIATLEEAVKLMAKHQLEKELDDEATKKIVAFLESLTGTIDPVLAKPPALPK